jgi:hypothetical protein
MRVLAGWRTGSEEGDVGEHVKDVYCGQGSRCVDLEGPDRILRQCCQLYCPARSISAV